MCICLNCERINTCKIYSAIEEKHEYKKTLTKFFFFAQSPILFCINCFYKNNIYKAYKIEWDIHECLSYEEKPGNWLLSLPKTLESSSYLIFDLFFNSI
uniref:hypothetical protein n=1 Tax=Ascoseira mirabilis TaxID=76830 RepID=UPI00300135D9|nr:hypothetical protein ASMI131 [Ascoseira mirabilis]